MKRHTKSTIIDVATRANVSIATVSRVINGKSSVKEQTRKHVEKIIKELNYLPNISARELNTQQSTTIGVVVPSIYNMFFAEVIDGIEAYLREYSYSLLLNCAQNDPQEEINCIRSLQSRNVSGIIIISPNTSELNEDIYTELSKSTPLVFINGYQHIPGASYVMNDEALGTQDAILYLQKLNHHKILFIRGENSDSYEIKELAFRNQLTAGLKNIDEYIVNIGDGNNKLTVQHTMEALLNILPTTDATAILCCNDFMAIGAMKACHELGKKIPEDMSIIGYDNIDIANYTTPALTTMDQNMYELGRNSAELLLDKISNGQVKRVILYNSLIQRQSTGPAPTMCSKIED